MPSITRGDTRLSDYLHRNGFVLKVISYKFCISFISVDEFWNSIKTSQNNFPFYSFISETVYIEKSEFWPGKQITNSTWSCPNTQSDHFCWFSHPYSFSFICSIHQIQKRYHCTFHCIVMFYGLQSYCSWLIAYHCLVV